MSDFTSGDRVIAQLDEVTCVPGTICGPKMENGMYLVSVDGDGGYLVQDYLIIPLTPHPAQRYCSRINERAGRDKS